MMDFLGRNAKLFCYILIIESLLNLCYHKVTYGKLDHTSCVGLLIGLIVLILTPKQ
jgi:hypothetical protein